MSAQRILIIEDDRELASLVATYLGDYGFAVQVAETAREGFDWLRRGDFGALLLDVMLPDLDGFEVCRTIRETSDIPILMLTARGESTDRIVGLELGADDYLPKPFEPRELLARLRAILRRVNSPRSEREILRFGGLELDRGARQVRLEGELREITAYQFDLLWALAESAGRVLSRDELMNRVRGVAHSAFDRSIDVHVSRIRAAIEQDAKKPKRLLTVRGAGYLFARNQGD